MPSRSERKVWRSLRKRKGRDATGWFMAEGRTLVADVIAAGAEGAVVLVEHEASGASADLAEAARGAGWRVEEVERRVIEEIADTRTPQSALAVVRIPRWTWEDIGAGPLLLLDGIQDPGNVGTLIRTAIALGAAGVVLLEESADPWGPKAFRASAGAALRRPAFAADTHSTIAELRHRKIALWVCAADGEPVDAGSADNRIALALGSESRGVSRTVEAAAARRVGIEMRAGVESLNVAGAGAILLDRIVNGSSATPQTGTTSRTEDERERNGD